MRRRHLRGIQVVYSLNLDAHKVFCLGPNTGIKGTPLRPWPDARMAAQLAKAAVVFPLE